MIVLFSPEHTGTNFVREFLHGIGFYNNWFDQVHSLPVNITNDFFKKYQKAIVPVRHPYLAYQSALNVGGGHDAFIQQWHCLIDSVEKFREVFYLPLITPANKRIEVLNGLSNFVRCKDDKFIQTYAKEWKRVNAHNYAEKDFDKSLLNFAVEAYKKWI